MKLQTQQADEFRRLMDARLARSPHRKDPDAVRAELSAELQGRKWRSIPRPHWCTLKVETCGVCYCPDPEQTACTFRCWACGQA